MCLESDGGGGSTTSTTSVPGGGSTTTTTAPGGDATTTVPGVTPVNVGGAAEGEIHPGGEEDWFGFTAAASGAYAIETELGTLEDSVMYLYGPESQTTLLAWNDDREDGGAGDRSSRIEVELTPGSYFIKVRGYRTNQRGTYTVRVAGP